MNQKTLSMAGMVLMLGIGVLLVIRPGMALHIVVIMMAAMMLLNSLLVVLAYFNEKEERNPVNLATAVLTMVLGVIGLIRPRSLAEMFPLIMGIAFAVSGLSALAGSCFDWKMQIGLWLPRMILGLVLIGLAVLLILNPFSSALTLTRIIGWFLIFFGGCGLVSAISRH